MTDKIEIFDKVLIDCEVLAIDEDEERQIQISVDGYPVWIRRSRTRQVTKPFDWEDAKQGMAFTDCLYNTVYFVAHEISDSNYIVVTDKEASIYFTELKGSLLRTPEKDLKL